jgi:hypothetical protein
MNQNELQAVALILEHQRGHVYVFADGSARWADVPPNPKAYPFPDDCPANIPCAPFSYAAARNVYKQAIKSLRLRGVR